MQETTLIERHLFFRLANASEFSPSPTEEDKPSTEGLPTSWISRASYMFLYRFYELLEDFSVTSDDVVQEVGTRQRIPIFFYIQHPLDCFKIRYWNSKKTPEF